MSSASLSAQNAPAAPSEAEQLANAIATATSGTVDVVDVETIAEARAVQAIPALEQQFVRATDVTIKAKIASGLVRLDDKDNTYWNYLEEQAELAVNSDIPEVVTSSSRSKGNPFPPELQAWADAHKVSVNTAAIDSLYNLPGKVMLLAGTGDPRGIPLLRRALQSHNSLIALWAAKGLVLIADKESIPLIVAACEREPAYASLLAQSLIWLDSPEAQAAVDTYVPKEQAKIWRDARTEGMGVFGWQRIHPTP